MAFQAMSLAVEKKCGSASTKLVLLMLANHTNGHTGQCNPSHKRLAEECDMSVSCLKSHLQKLESMGFISIVHRSKDGVMLPNQYVLNLNDKLGGVGQNMAGVGQNMAGGGSESGWGVGQNLATETGSIETGIETPPISPTGGAGEQNPTSLSLFTLASSEPDGVQGTSQPAETGKGAQRSKRKVKGADLPPYAAWFEECWKAYPRRSGKANAWRAFYELDELGELPSDMVERIKNRCFEPDWQRGIKNPDDERFIPHMSTWLHSRGWEDEGCESVTDSRNTPEDKLRNEIMGKYNFGMPMPGDTLEQATKRSDEMNLELDAAGL